MKHPHHNSIRSQLMAQTFFFALIFTIFASIAAWQIFNFTQFYVATTKRNAAIQLASGQAIAAAKQMDWLIQRILLSQYRGNFTRVIARQGDLLETMADFEMFIEALNWGSESHVFKSADGGIHYKRWVENGWNKQILLEDLPENIRQYAGTAHLYYTAFMRYTHEVITHIQGNLNAVAQNDSASAAKHLALASESNKKIERFENLGSTTLNQLITFTHQLNQASLQMLQKSLRNTLAMIAVSAIFLLLFLFTINHIVFSNLIAKPLERLTDEVQKMDAEDLNFSISTTGSSEIASLISKFNELIARLKQTTVKRDALVQEIKNHEATTKKLQASYEALEMKKSELTSILIDLKRSHEELRQTQMRLVEAAKLESVGRLAAGVAHEVKNPLFIIQMGVDYLRALPEMKKSDHAGMPVINDIAAAVERANGIIKGMLNFSTPHDLSMETSNINDVLEESLNFLKHLFSSNHTQIIKNMDSNLPPIILDRQKMHQVFINLFMNAVQAMPATGTLIVNTRYQPAPTSSLQNTLDGFTIIEILDTGIGFTEKSLERAFDPFFTTKPTGQGTGLGLAVTQKIIKLHGGTITLKNRPEGGSQITVKIPKERRLEYAEAKNPGR
ncbi:MAG: HAMP domain-containing protein [Candidatus Omnitrophica bacterium]|nr:HAMP domain-containing protein [Candidatus Omnitrophota bacterium]